MAILQDVPTFQNLGAVSKLRGISFGCVLDSLASRNQGTSLSPLSSNMLTTLTPGTSCSQGFRVRICEKPVKPELPPTLTMNYSDSQGGLSTTRAWLLNPTNFVCSVPCQCTVSPYLMGKSCFSQSVVW